MEFRVTDLGGGQDSGAFAQTTVTITGVTVPQGSVIVLCATENNASVTAVSGVVNDGGSNTYRNAASVPYAGTNSIGTVYYAWNSVAISGATITYTKGNPNAAVAIAGFYAVGARTNLDPLETDNIGIGKNVGLSQFPSVSTPGFAEMAAQLYVGVFFGWFNLFTAQDTNHAWTFPPTPINTPSGSACIGGGCFVLPDQSVLTYAPTASNVNEWGMLIVPILPPQPSSILLPQAHM